MIKDRTNGLLTSLVAVFKREAIEDFETVFGAAREATLILIEACKQDLVVNSHIVSTQFIQVLGIFIFIHC